MRSVFSYRRYRRLPIGWWTAVLLVAVTAGAFVAQSVSRAEAGAQKYGGLVPVLIAQRSIEAGTVVSADDIAATTWPRAFLPSVTPVTEAVGRVATVTVAAGQPLSEANLGTAGLSPTAAMLRQDEQAVAVPSSAAMPPLQIGDTVDVVATFDSVTSGSEPSLVIAPQARVVNVSAGAITLAVGERDVPKVAFASAKGTVVLALSTVVAHSQS